MNILRDVTVGILPYQQATWDKISGGYKRGEMVIYSGGRGVGKSTLNHYTDIFKSLYYSRPLTTMKPEPKYKFSRKWHVADFDWAHHDEVLEWCSQQFGPHPANPDAWSRWYNKYSEKIHFRDERDYVLFVLRWS